MWRALAAVLVLVAAACTPNAVPAGPRAFERWLAADEARRSAFARFEAMLAREGVSGVASGYRDEAFNICVGGAPQSAHREYFALDLVPKDRRITRERLIAVLCPIHAREGPRYDIGMGIYRARRFHIDARGYRGWGDDFRGATFPCH